MNQVELIPILDDNYVFLVKNSETREALVIDPGEASSVIAALTQQNLTIKAILITHHHDDHIDGAQELKELYNCPVYAPLKNKVQIPQATHYIEDKQNLHLAGFNIQSIELPGHTLGITGYYFSDEHWLFSGDVLFGLGCGRLFEGTPRQLHASLQKIHSLPDDTLVFCAHEYTEANLRFCQSLAPELKQLIPLQNLTDYQSKLQQKRQQHLPSVPLLLATEKKTNPFLRADLEKLTQLRELRNHFR